MSEAVQCFWVDQTWRVQQWLRRYTSDQTCPLYGYHNAKVRIDDTQHPLGILSLDDTWPHDDARWPRACACGYVFDECDPWQVWRDRVFEAPSTHQQYGMDELPPGAMYDAWWFHDIAQWIGPGGLSVCVILPTREPWNIDSVASNCTRPHDVHHKCWVRHGDPRAVPAVLTVDKNGVTCQAGGGSIAVPGWHGFLREGKLVSV